MIIYGLAVAIVIVYFILKTLFPQNTSLELRHFNTQTESYKKLYKDEEVDTKEETQVQEGFILLPQK